MKQYTTVLANFQEISTEEVPKEPKDRQLESILARLESEWKAHQAMQSQMFSSH